jgi:hypothetical protein
MPLVVVAQQNSVRSAQSCHGDCKPLAGTKSASYQHQALTSEPSRQVETQFTHYSIRSLRGRLIPHTGKREG